MAGAGTTGLLDAVHDRILILGRNGKVLYTNTPARGDFSGELSGLLTAPALRDAAKRLWSNPTLAPLRLKLPGEDSDTFDVSLVMAPNGSDIAVVVHARAGAAATQGSTQARTTAELMRQHLLDPLKKFVATARTPDAEVSAAGADLVARMEKVIDLVAVFGDEVLVTDERVVMTPLVESVCRDLGPTRLAGRARIVLTGFDADLPPVYGSERWIRRAVHEIVDNAVQHGILDTAPGSIATVEIVARQGGEFMTLQFINRGAFAQALPRNARLVPFAKTAPNAAKPPVVTRIGLPLAQRIIELHGGTLRVNDEADADVEVTVQLPTGAPRFAQPRIDIEQAQRYAQDLSKLLARQRRRSTPPPVEPVSQEG